MVLACPNRNPAGGAGCPPAAFPLSSALHLPFNPAGGVGNTPAVSPLCLLYCLWLLSFSFLLLLAFVHFALLLALAAVTLTQLAVLAARRLLPICLVPCIWLHAALHKPVASARVLLLAGPALSVSGMYRRRYLKRIRPRQSRDGLNRPRLVFCAPSPGALGAWAWALCRLHPHPHPG